MPEKWQYDHSNILLFLCFDHHMCTCCRPPGNFLCLILQTLFVLCCKSFASKKAEMQLSSRLGLTLRRIKCRFGDKNVHGKPSAHSMQGFVEIKSTTHYGHSVTIEENKWHLYQLQILSFWKWLGKCRKIAFHWWQDKDLVLARTPLTQISEQTFKSQNLAADDDKV